MSGYRPADDDGGPSWTEIVQLSPDCGVYGGGEKNPGINLRGRTRRLRNTEIDRAAGRDTAYLNVPLLWTDAGWAVFVNSGSTITADIAATHSAAMCLDVDDDELDIFLIAGDPPTILHRYGQLTGHQRMLPDWAFGVWMSRSSYFTADEMVGVADEFHAADCPVDVVHVDEWLDQVVLDTPAWTSGPDRSRFPPAGPGGCASAASAQVCGSTPTREPTAYPEPARRAAIAACNFRKRVQDYVITVARTASTTGTPMIRPMVPAYPGDRAARDADLQYLLGPDVFVAPILQPGGARSCWIPAGQWEPLCRGDTPPRGPAGRRCGASWTNTRRGADTTPTSGRARSSGSWLPPLRSWHQDGVLGTGPARDVGGQARSPQPQSSIWTDRVSAGLAWPGRLTARAGLIFRLTSR